MRAAIGYATLDRLQKKLFNPGRSIEMQSMSEQMISRPKKEEEMGKGLTAEQRRHLEKSLKENDELMKCLAEM